MDSLRYISLLRVRYGWRDLRDRAKRHRKQAQHLRDEAAKLEQRLADFVANFETELPRLRVELEGNPYDRNLLMLCANLARTWLSHDAGFDPDKALTVLSVGLGLGCGNQLSTLLELYHAARLLRDTAKRLLLASDDQLQHAIAGAAQQLSRFEGSAAAVNARATLAAVLAERLLALGERNSAPIATNIDNTTLLGGLRLLAQIVGPGAPNDTLRPVIIQVLRSAVAEKDAATFHAVWDFANGRYEPQASWFWKDADALVEEQVRSATGQQTSLDFNAIEHVAAELDAALDDLEMFLPNESRWSEVRAAITKQRKDILPPLKEASQLYEAYLSNASEERWGDALRSLDQIRRLDLQWENPIRLEMLTVNAASELAKLPNVTSLAAMQEEFTRRRRIIAELLEEKQVTRTVRDRLEENKNKVVRHITNLDLLLKDLENFEQDYAEAIADEYSPSRYRKMYLLLKRIDRRLEEASQYANQEFEQFKAAVREEFEPFVVHGVDGLLDYFALIAASEEQLPLYLLNQLRSKLKLLPLNANTKNDCEAKIKDVEKDYGPQSIGRR